MSTFMVIVNPVIGFHGSSLAPNHKASLFGRGLNPLSLLTALDEIIFSTQGTISKKEVKTLFQGLFNWDTLVWDRHPETGLQGIPGLRVMCVHRGRGALPQHHLQLVLHRKEGWGAQRRGEK